jgi:hypothetical protein
MMRATAERQANLVLDTEHERSIWRRSPLKGSSGDYRPNRTLRGSSRTSLVMRKHGFFNETRARDELIRDRTFAVGGQKRGQVGQHSTRAVHLAAEKIQRTWKSYRKYCLEHEEYFSICNSAITKIQRRWRFYHKDRVYLDRCASQIQRFARGIIVRGILTRNNAAVTIQRHAAGFLCRKMLARLNTAAVHCERLVRGGLGRRYVTMLRKHRSDAACIVQNALRGRVKRMRRRNEIEKRVYVERQLHLAHTLQRYCRGINGRKIYARLRAEYLDEVRLAMAATRIQASVRRDLATRRVASVRKERKQRMFEAATHIRKAWLGFKVRRQYQELREKFLDNQVQCVVMQRYIRGFLVRNRIWRSAAQAESELWASVELQRMWRGYRGRLRWECAYEQYWSRMVAAVRVQKSVRSWLAAMRVRRIRQSKLQSKLAKERLHFAAAQRIQKHTRGMTTRTHVFALLRYLYGAAMQIQKIWRGYAVRSSISKLVLNKCACRAQAHMRGYLVRARFRYLNAQITLIQKRWRKFCLKPAAERERNRKLRMDRIEATKVLQSQWRVESSRKQGAKIHAAELTFSAPKPEGPEELQAYLQGQKVLGGVYRRLERKWSRAAVKIQRSVRIRMLRIPIEEARKVPFTHAPLTRGVV